MGLDIKHLQENPEEPGEGLEEEQEQEAEVEAEDDQQQQIIEKCLKDLQQHANCLSAWWMTRKCFRVRRKDKRFSDFAAKNLQRKQNSEEAERQFHLQVD